MLIRAAFYQAKEDGVAVLEIGEDVWGLGTFFHGDIEELVDAFENGRLYIDEEVPQGLLEMENPYYSDGREGIIYEWDHLLVQC